MNKNMNKNIINEYIKNNIDINNNNCLNNNNNNNLNNNNDNDNNDNTHVNNGINNNSDDDDNNDDDDDDYGPSFQYLKKEENLNNEIKDNFIKNKIIKLDNDDKLEIDNIDNNNNNNELKNLDKTSYIKDDKKEYEELLKNLPNTDFYECSFMHKKQVTHILTSSKTGFIITASIDGVIKFWKINFIKNKYNELNNYSNNNHSIEYIKGFQAHKNEISDLAISNCGLFLISISKYENNYKLFNIINFDMISIVKIPIKPNKCIFINSDIEKNASFILYPEIAISELESNNIYILPSNGNSINNMDNIPKYNNHKYEITCMCYLPKLNIIISSDINGGIEFWNPKTMMLPKIDLNKKLKIKNKLENNINFKYKIETDLFELEKNKCYAINMTISNNEKLLAIYSSDIKIRIFDIITGKCIRIYDENISIYNNYQNDPNFKIYHLDHIEFGIRCTIENEILTSKENNYKTICFDDSCRFLIFPSIIGINIIDIINNKRISVIGKMECNKRFISIGLIQIHRNNMKDFINNNKEDDNKFLNVESIIVASSFKSNRIYVFSRFLPLLENGEINLKRDIFNEIPTLEELEIQKQLEIFSSENKVNNNKRIAKKIILHTSKGDITIELLSSIAPKACENFTVHCFNGYYNNCIFHRVIKGFMIQSGDPTGDGTGGESIWGKEFEDEISPNIKHDKPFILSMANAGPNTNTSQFFITTVPCPWLDGIHTIFGYVIQGKEYVQEIEHVKTNQHDKPINDVFIVSTSVIF